MELLIHYVLDRREDESGVSGTGIVADAVEFPNGKFVVVFRGETSSVIVYDCIEDAVKIHGHQGKTQFVSVGAA